MGCRGKHDIPFLVEGTRMGIEPTTFGITIRRSNRLSYQVHIGNSLLENWIFVTSNVLI